MGGDSAETELDGLVVVALGANLAGAQTPVERLESALACLSDHGLQVVKRSRWWISQAWPDPNDPPFVNGVALVRAGLEPEAVLNTLHTVEWAFGRTRVRRNGPRTLDLDLVAHGGLILNGPALVLPHPRAAERLFVMGPLAEIAPDWRHPLSGCTAAELAAATTVGCDARPSPTGFALQHRRQSPIVAS